MPAKPPKAKPANPPKPAKAGTLTADERAAMKERLRELKGEGQGVKAVLEKYAAMDPADRALGQRIHAIVKANAPQLTPRLWYGMPAYAKDDKVVCFFQDAKKFKARYSTFGFSDKASLDDGNLWPTSFALTKLTAADEARLAALVRKAVA